MNRIFHDYLDKFVIVYLDDMLIFSKTVEEHVAHLDKVLSLLRQHKFKINGEKCEFGRTRVLYLGHEISAEGLKPDDAKVASIRDWPRPQSVTEMRSFLGMTCYYRTFVKNYSIVAAPLIDLTRLDSPWEWTDECEAAFRHLKHALTHYEVLKLPDPDKPFIVTTDASQYGIGAVLAQQEGPKLRPVEYMFKKIPLQKLAKPTYEKERYAVYKALTHWRHYLLGRFFILRTDHQTLRWMRTQPVLSDALKRWIEVIEQYDFDPQYLKGEYNKVADALSRRPDFSDVMKSYLRKWCKEPGDVDIRTIVDWDYYRTRLGSAIQKIITIPAAMQRVTNPVPRVQHPDWLWKKLREKDDKYRQRSIKDMFGRMPPARTNGDDCASDSLNDKDSAPGNKSDAVPKKVVVVGDVEDGGLTASKTLGKGTKKAVVKRVKKGKGASDVKKSAKGGTEQANGAAPNGALEHDEGSCTIPPKEGNEDGADGEQRAGMCAKDASAEERVSTAEEGPGRADAQENGSMDINVDDSTLRDNARAEDNGANDGDVTVGAEMVDGADVQGHDMVEGGPASNGSVRAEDDVAKGGDATNDGGAAANGNTTVEGSESAAAKESRKRKGKAIARDGNGGPPKKSKKAGKKEELKRRRLREMEEANPTQQGRRLREELRQGVRAFFRHKEASLTSSHWQIDVPESHFRSASRELSAHLSDPDVEGIYETKMPLHVNAILAMGCVCTVDPSAKGRSVAEGFSIEELHIKSTAGCSYLSDASNTLTFFFLYQSSCDTRGIYAFFVPLSNSIQLLVVNPFMNKEVVPTLLERHYKEVMRCLAVEAGEANAPPADLACKVDYVANDVEAAKKLQQFLLQYNVLLRTEGVTWQEVTLSHLAYALQAPREIVDLCLLSSSAMGHIRGGTVWTQKLALWKEIYVRCRLPETADAVYNQLLFDNRFICDEAGDPYPWQGPRGPYEWKWAEQGIFKVGHLWDENRKDWRTHEEMDLALHGRMKKAQRVKDMRDAIPSRWVEMLKKDEVAGGQWVKLKGNEAPERLYRVKQILWMSDNGMPDLGGISEEEEASFADEVQQPELVYAGAYRTVCVELKVHHLAVNALLKCSQVNELEGGSLLGVDIQQLGGPTDLPMGACTTYDDVASCGSAFRILKQMVQALVSDAVGSSNVYADALLQHLYRWLCSPQSKLHDPALHRILHKVMQKVFALLLGEIKKLGAMVVYADFSKIVICTGKRKMQAAEGYCVYLLETLRSRELFEWVELIPERYWHTLLFMDQFNYGGIQATPSKGSKNTGAANSQGISESQSSVDKKDEMDHPDIISCWNIVEYLPKATQEYFVVVVSEYIYIPWKHGIDKDREREASREQQSQPGTQSVTVAATADIEEEEKKFLRQQIASYFTDKLLRIVKDVQRHVGLSKRNVEGDVSSAATPLSTPASSQDFAVQMGVLIDNHSPALAFIKTICAVMMLDQTVDQKVRIMRKNLLKLVHVREFAEEAEFKNPCVSFTLPNVICSYCNDCRDLDLCRDTALLAREWRCAVPQCGQPYDRDWIENALLQVVRQRARLYQLQDLKCQRCRQVKADRLAEQCKCAGPFCCTESPLEFRQRLRVFLNIARYHGFILLQEAVEWLLEIDAAAVDPGGK
ncbi:hypothetical protein CBR_g8396 [Chara braunii]|uniref:DNA polymerase epsilon catalytic subunit n=1 Tax=Chara braunii TaxID=69332 RepID=A0A388KM27_CHABU|nr:hypothetical protein CBR_g8396 [Chara braunii]|eukprot:GBG71097.1 hypothetical protein CBR_g8396 [Chara braunii]